MTFYRAMLQRYGPQHWWPGDSPFEVLVGAVLTQNTSWRNVEKAIANLRDADVLDAPALDRMSQQELAELIRPAGYYNVKARRLKNLIGWFCSEHNGDLDTLKHCPVNRLREELLRINGIGRETADAIILYALDKPTFVVDTYTYRVLLRHHLIAVDCGYEEMKVFFERNLPADATLFNEYHALLVRVGKDHCKPSARCSGCPLESFEHELECDADQ